MAVSMIAFVGLVALSADIGLVFLARSEAQRAADAAALAGIRAWVEDPADTDRAADVARAFAFANTVRGEPVDLLPEDFGMEVGTDTAFHVEVHRLRERGNPIRTLFASVLGIDAVDVSAYASAGVTPSGTTRCFKPFLVVDAWDDTDGDGEYDAGEYYDAQETGYGSDWRLDMERDVGRQVIVYGPGPGAVPGGGMHNPSWYGLYNVNGQPGANAIREQIERPDCDPTPYSIGDMVENETGAKTGAVNSAIEDLMDLDPGAYWNATTNAIAGSAFGADWQASPRVARIALFDPSDMPGPGKTEIRMSNVTTVFIEGWDADGYLTARVLPTAGEADECVLTGECAAFSWYARIIR